jgi:hypothetical protein
MDTLRIKKKFFRRISNWALGWLIWTKTGVKVKVDVKDLEVINDDVNAKFHLEIEGTCKSEDLDKVLDKLGL